MIYIFRILFLLLLELNIILCATSGDTQESNTKLQLDSVIVLFRHGRRTSIIDDFLIHNVSWESSTSTQDLIHTMTKYTLLNLNGSENSVPSTADSYYDTLQPLNGGAKKGQLTTFGQEDSYSLGKLLKSHYLDAGKLKIKQRSNIGLYSTKYQRTIKTLRCVLAGIFPSESNESYRIYTRPNQFEIYHPNYRYCNRYKYIHDMQVSRLSSDTRQVSIKQKLANLLNMSIDSLPSVSQIWEEISAVKGHFQWIPPIFQQNFYIIQRAAVISFMFRHLKDDESVKYACGLLLNEIIDQLSNNTHESKLYLNSVHDSTIICLLTAIGYKVQDWPTFSSYVTFERYTNEKDDIFINVIYNGVNILITSNYVPMPFDQFLRKLKRFIPREKTFEELCQLQN